MLTIYHNPRCSKSRRALELLREAEAVFQVVEYLQAPPAAAELDAVLRKLGMEPAELMRKGEDVYSELHLADKALSRSEAIAVMVEHPILIERPIVVSGDRALVGRPPERVLELLGR
ncbi:MAG: arsenate reductase (glutaredoxin) [Cyanobacteria bacterium REEB65]|nr:arsenate reductase (glutaredoxin) [Cyanobacteria bacterium REEB65]